VERGENEKGEQAGENARKAPGGLGGNSFSNKRIKALWEEGGERGTERDWHNDCFVATDSRENEELFSGTRPGSADTKLGIEVHGRLRGAT